MFQKLPLEITLNIVRRLEFKDKLNLKTTCHKLNGQISKAVLFEELDLWDSECDRKSFEDIINTNDDIIQKLINDGFEGSLVKVLRFDIDLLSRPFFSKLSDLFPNVNRVITAKNEKLYESSSDYRHPQEYKKDVIDPLIKWRDNIEKIDTRYDWRRLKSDIMLWKYPQLTELDLGGLGNTLNFCIQNPKISFFQNAPLLTTLTLRGADINVKILEALHTGLPLIKSFRLVDPRVVFEKDVALPPSIEPANTVVFLGIESPREFYKNELILDYISKKYVNLQRLVYRTASFYDYAIKTRDDFERRFSVFGDEDEDEFEERVSTEIARSKAVFPIYSSTESKFFSNLPRTIKHLTLDINNIDNAVAALAESAMETIILDAIGTYEDANRVLKDPSSIKCFKNLKSLRAMKIALNSSVQTSISEYASISVTRLTISLYGISFSIEWVLSMFPSVEKLEINTSRGYISRSSSTEIKGPFDMDDNDKQIKATLSTKEHLKLQILTIMKCTIHPGFFDYVKTSLPHLDELNLEMTLLSSSRTTTTTKKIDLSNWHLNKFNLSFDCSYSSSFVRCIVTIENISKVLMIDHGHKVLLPSANQYKVRSRFDSDIRIELILDHINYFTLYGYRVIRIGNNIVIDI